MKSGTIRKLVYIICFLLVAYSNFCGIFDVKQSNDPEISPRSSTNVSLEIISNFSFYGRIVYNFRDRLLDVEMTT